MSERTLVRDLKEGDKLVVDLIYEGQVLLKKGTVLTAIQVERLHRRFANLEMFVNVSKDEQLDGADMYEQHNNDTNTISSISGHSEQRTVDVIHTMYGKSPDNWNDELREIKHCMSQIVDTVVNTAESSKNFCYDLHDFIAENQKERHLYRVAKIAIALANVYNSTVAKSAQINLTSIGMAALFHDYGKKFENEKDEIIKFRIESELLRKLNLHPQFFNQPYKSALHSVYAYAALKDTISDEVCKIVLFSGLHNSIVNKFGPEVPEVKAAKAIALCYAYDTLLEEVIRDNLPTPLENVLSVIDYGVRNGNFSHKAYNLFMDNILIYAPGTKVILTNGERATVTGNNRIFPSRPIVSLDNEQDGKNLIDLSETMNITISQILIEDGGVVDHEVSKLESTQLKKIVVEDE